MLQARELPRDEWPRLAALPIGAVTSLVPPDTRIVVVEDASGEIVATWAAIRYVHVEGIWVHPAHQKRGVVFGRLLQAMRGVARSWGATAVLTGALTDDVRRLIASLGGQPLPGDHFALPVEAPPCR